MSVNEWKFLNQLKDSMTKINNKFLQKRVSEIINKVNLNSANDVLKVLREIYREQSIESSKFTNDQSPPLQNIVSKLQHQEKSSVKEKKWETRSVISKVRK